jgi:hypothetical protein
VRVRGYGRNDMRCCIQYNVPPTTKGIAFWRCSVSTWIRLQNLEWDLHKRYSPPWLRHSHTYQQHSTAPPGFLIAINRCSRLLRWDSGAYPSWQSPHLSTPVWNLHLHLHAMPLVFGTVGWKFQSRLNREPRLAHSSCPDGAHERFKTV